MGWKDWSYWLKGGCILLIINLIFIILAFILPAPSFELNKNYESIGALFLIPSYLIFINITRIFDAGLFINLILIPSISYFIIGALIGYIVGKIKSRKQTPTKK